MHVYQERDNGTMHGHRSRMLKEALLGGISTPRKVIG
jgi:hypothetical protein